MVTIKNPNGNRCAFKELVYYMESPLPVPKSRTRLNIFNHAEFNGQDRIKNDQSNNESNTLEMDILPPKPKPRLRHVNSNNDPSVPVPPPRTRVFVHNPPPPNTIQECELQESQSQENTAVELKLGERSNNDDELNEILIDRNKTVSLVTKKENESEQLLSVLSETNKKTSITKLLSEEHTAKDSRQNNVDSTLLAIYIHRSDCLKMNVLIRHPSVMVHILDSKTGQYFRKTEPDKNVTYNEEKSAFILPAMTKPYDFKQNCCIVPEWEETVIFNESLTSMLGASPSSSMALFFFEIVDFVDSAHSDETTIVQDQIGWRRIAWAFLKPQSTANGHLNVDKMLRLQLYKPILKSNNLTNGQKNGPPDVFNWYSKNKWRLYPSTLFVTVKQLEVKQVDNKPQQRSCTPLQPEHGSEASIKSTSSMFTDQDNSSSDPGGSIPAFQRLAGIEWSRLPGQSSQLPNTRIGTLYFDSRTCLALKFSNSGLLLACGTNQDVFVYAIDGLLEKRLTGHEGLMYTLCWSLDDSLLLSSSADCTASIWEMKTDKSSPIQVLPHPSFVYCACFISANVAITGCYDGIIRIWHHMEYWQLNQEAMVDGGFVSAMCSVSETRFITGDSDGVLVCWTKSDTEQQIWSRETTVKISEIRGVVVNNLILISGGKRLLVHTRDSLLRTLDLATFAVIQWYQGGLNEKLQCGCTVSPCGSMVFAVSEDGTVNVWQCNTGKLMAMYTIPVHKLGAANQPAVISSGSGAIDYHPFDNIVAFSTSYHSTVLLLKYSAYATRKTKDEVGLVLVNDEDSSDYKEDHTNYEIEYRSREQSVVKKNKKKSRYAKSNSSVLSFERTVVFK